MGDHPDNFPPEVETSDAPAPEAQAPEAVGQEPAPKRPSRAKRFLRVTLPVVTDLVILLLLAGVFRFQNLDWDDRHHLHPDERFLTSVVNDLGWPESFRQYMSEPASPLNPRNRGKTYFTYGTLPTTIVKGVAVFLNNSPLGKAINGPLQKWHEAKYGHRLDIPWDSYDRVYLLGRALSGIFDLGTLVVLYFMALVLLRDRCVARIAALLYAFAVSPIQHSHFWVVDNFAVFFITAALLFLVVAQRKRHGLWAYPLSGIFFGMAMASKASVVTFALLPAVLGARQVWIAWAKRESTSKAVARITSVVAALLIMGLLSILTFRVGQPDAFRRPGLFDFIALHKPAAPAGVPKMPPIMDLSPRWWRNMDEVKGINVTGERDVPFTLQWVGKTDLWYPLKIMVLWGMGPLLGILAWAAWLWALWRWLGRGDWRLALLVLWTGVLFVHQGGLWVKTMRYYLPVYPALCLLAAWALMRLWGMARGGKPGQRPRLASRILPTLSIELLIVVVLLGTLAWACAFTAVYRHPHPRVEASRWMIENLPRGAVLGCEHWDDTLPLRLPKTDPWGRGGPNGKAFREVKLGWYDPDNPAKMKRELDRLDEVGYIVLSSNRLYDSVPLLPIRYPMSINYYRALFDGSLGFKKVADFTSYPNLFGVQIPDQSAEEAFHVYDHPRVQIFAKTPRYNHKKAEQILSKGVKWDRIRHVRGIEANRAPTRLQFTDAEWKEYREHGTWTEIFHPHGWPARHPVLAWIIVIEILALVGFPYALAVGRGLPDRGFGLSPALGLLLVSWLAWMAASLRLLPWGRAAIVTVMVVLLAEGVILLIALRRSLLALLRRRWRLILVEFVLFYGLFAFLLTVRYMNPDLWHPARGGEKPMEMAYLNAVVKSFAMPPYDPWFAGGFINYYYYGFVMSAVPIHLTGIPTSVAFNLLVPTFFALTGLGTFCVALGLSSRRKPRRHMRWRDLRYGLWAVVFVLIMGNLGEVKVWLGFLSQDHPKQQRERMDDLSKATAWLADRVKGTPGLQRFERFGPHYNDHWFWNASRAIAHKRGEAPPITEFPYFTFLYADLHPHMMALPLTLLALALCVAIMRFSEYPPLPHAPPRRHHLRRGLLIVLLALTVGALWPTNAWDYPAYAGMALAAIVFSRWRKDGRLTVAGLTQSGGVWLLFVLIGVAMFLPFRLNYGAAYTSIEAWRGSRTPVWDYLVVHGFMLFVLLSAIARDLARGRGLSAPARIPRLFLARLTRPRRLAAALRHWHAIAHRGFLWWGIVLCLAAVWAVAIVAIWKHHAPAGVGALGASLALFVAWRKKPDPTWQFALVGAAGALILTVFVEFLVLKGDISRMNTVFKFYLQAWVLLGVAGAVGMARMRRLRAPWPRGKLRIAWRVAQWIAWRAVFLAFLFSALLYPIYATPARIRDRFDRVEYHGLDGAKFMETVVHRHKDKPMKLEWDRQAIEWMQMHVAGSPVVAEANTRPILYGWGNRYAMFTGLPAVAGWDWHQRQQRALLPYLVELRIRELQRFYETPNVDEARQFIDRYKIRYIVVGPLERIVYSPVGFTKFDRPPQGAPWKKVYENEGVRILQVLN